MSTLPVRALEIAVSQLGVRELARNRGPAVESYLAAVGLGPGHPWCAAFVVWCTQRAASETGDLCPLPITGSVHKLWARAPEWARIARPVPGAIFCYDAGEGKGHTGIVESVTSDHTICIEGNTDDGGSREGDGVYRKMRRLAYVNMGWLLLDPEEAARINGHA